MRSSLSIRSAVALALLGVAAVSSADLIAHFDAMTEGEVYDAFSSGGITFHDVIAHEGGLMNFEIENASGGFLGEGVSMPNVLGFGGYAPGPDVQFGCIGAFQFEAAVSGTTAGMDIWTFQGETGVNTLALRGYRGSDLIASVSFSFDFTATPNHHRLDLPTGNYQRFELFSSGAAHLGDSCIVVDNVTIAAVPEPATLATLGLGLVVAAWRRRSRRRM